LLFVLRALFPCPASLEAQTQSAENGRPSGGHRGRINALVRGSDGRIVSAGEDGFIGVWDTVKGRAEKRFQIGGYAILSLASHPGRNEVAAIESDRMGLYRVSVWDYVQKKNLFALRFSDPLLFVNYSASGGFIIVSRSARSAVVLIQSGTWELFQAPEDLAINVSLAATGRSERTMITYSQAGSLSYWELETRAEIRRFSVPANLQSPLLFGNNSFLAALEERRLVILDAASGKGIFRESGRNHLALFPSENEGREFLALSTNGTTTELLRYRVTGAAAGIEITARKTIPASVTVSAAIGGVSSHTAILGASDGRLYFLAAQGDPVPAAVSAQVAVREGAVSGGILAFIAPGGLAGFIPLDFSGFSAGFPLRLFQEPAFTRITSAPSASPEKAASPGEAAGFLYWRDSGVHHLPVLKTVSPGYSGNRGYPEYREQSRTQLSHLSMRYPLTSVSVLENHALFLDSKGAIQILSLDSQTVEFSFASAASLDAAFMDERNIILARGAQAGNSPFLKIDTVTGETVPLQYPAAMGVRVFRGDSGNFYGAVITGNGENSKTGILLLNADDGARSVGVAEYSGEDLDFSLAEENGTIAFNLGGDGAALYNGQEILPFERADGLPRRILGGGGFFVVVDSEGGIAWHDAASGKLAALLRVYPDEWILEKKDGTLRGPVLTAAE
jgi:hypothetical protein